MWQVEKIIPHLFLEVIHVLLCSLLRLSQKMTIEVLTRHIGKYEKSILDMVNAASGESDQEDVDEPIGEGERGEEDKSSGKEKFSGVLLYSRFQSFCEGHCVREPSQDQEAIHSMIIAKLEAFSQSFCF